MLAANRAKDDQETYFNRLQYNRAEIAKAEDLIRPRIQNWMGSEFDRGFFTAWADFIDYFGRNRRTRLGSADAQNRRGQSSSDNSEVLGESVE